MKMWLKLWQSYPRLTALKLNYRQYSDKGAPLLVLHGLFGSLSNWSWHCKQLAQQFAVIGVDLRNHGSSPHDCILNYPVMAQDMLQLLEDLNIDSCYLLGHSMGGKMAMELALTAPAKVERLLVVDIAPVSYTTQSEGHMQVIAGMKALDLDGLDSRASAEAFLRHHIHDEPTRKFVLTNLINNPGGSYCWRLNLSAIERHYDALRDMPDHVSVFQKPTLFVKGAESAYILSKHREQTLAYFPQSDVKIIMGAGHWLHADKPQVFQKIAMDFLTSKECVGRSSLAEEKMR